MAPKDTQKENGKGKAKGKKISKGTNNGKKGNGTEKGKHVFSNNPRTGGGSAALSADIG